MKPKNKTERTPLEEYEHKVRVERVKILMLTLTGVILFCVLLALFASSLTEGIRRNRPAEPAEGIGRESAAEAQRYAAPAEQAEEGTALRVWCETDEDLPEWWDPDAAEVVYTAPGPVRDIASPDWNLNTAVVGWDGRLAEVWELDLLSRIFYLEFWGSSPECCEAGIDAILRLWESGEFGNTLGGVLTAVNAAGKYVYSTYPDVWTTVYDENGLAWCREYCEARFAAGPVWIATYFQKYGYPSGTWNPVPCYEIDGVFFSVRGW